MKRYLFLIMCCLALYMNAQNPQKWEDPYVKPDAPGYEDYKEARKHQLLLEYAQYFSYLQKAMEKGNLAAGYEGAAWFLQGYKGTDVQFQRDTIKALAMYRLTAEGGYAPGQFMMALYSLPGGINGVNSQLGLSYASKMLLSSAGQGYIPAKSTLAICYLQGSYGFQRNTEIGLKLAEECANAGDVSGQWILGCFYSGTQGNPPDYTKALKWLTIAADNGKWEACNTLAYLYARGNGTEVNFQKAHSLIKDARLKAQSMGVLDRGVEANLLDSEGEICMIEGKTEESLAIWQQLKEKYPEFVEKNKYEIGNVFVRTMYKKEQDEVKSSIANVDNGKPVITQIISDVDEKIPENAITGAPTFAVIIANEKYMDVEEVLFAIHDGETFKEYCEKTLGIPQSNIKFVKNATLNNMKRETNWLSQVMDVYQGKANIIFYYSGHGIPNESNGSAYLLPVDGVGNDISTGYSLDNLYSDLGSKPAKSVFVILDACFSGTKRDGGMLVSARGVAIKAKQNTPKGNMVVLSAAQGDETAYPYKEKGHGMFTYYLLKKLQETKGDISLGELADFVTTEVKKQSIVVNGKKQTPLASPSSNASDWRNWKLR